MPQEPRPVSGESSPADPASSSSSSSLSNSGGDNLTTRSQLFKRPPRFRAQPPRNLATYDEDVDDPNDQSQNVSAEFPFARPKGGTRRTDTTTVAERNGAASREPQEKGSSVRRNSRLTNNDQNATQQAPGPETSSSITSSVSDATNPDTRAHEPPSGNHRAVMAQLSPRRKGPRSRKEGSEGTPSMGSSFSDIDGTYI